MALTGRRDGPPLGPPAPLVGRVAHVGEVLRHTSRRLGAEIAVDGLALLGERAALAGLRRNGAISCGGGTRLLAARDGWLALSLARPDDVALVPAWLGTTVPDDDPWDALAGAVAGRAVDEVVVRAASLGLPVAGLGERATPRVAPHGCFEGLPVRATRACRGPARARALDRMLVVDLSALWAGPLCAGLLASGGATVVKVESMRRPDGARQGPDAFFRLLNGHKHQVALDLGDEYGRAALEQLLHRADVVVEASRPRALEQLGIDVNRHLAAGTTRVWVSITGHGRTGRGGNRVAFGDDAAVAGGLVAWEDGRPLFCADALADPAAGLVAAAAALVALDLGGSWLLDIAMAEVAAHLAGPTLRVPGDVVAAPARARALQLRGRDEEDRRGLARGEQPVHLRS
jgi:hypothetical protein